jgi:ABC-type transport system involved in multi-copper enzyme maturation permease subunit
MNSTFQPSGNAVLMRELRASLRNARPFALIALYVAVLGAIVVANFPANQDIQITIAQGSSGRGKDLYWIFVLVQAALIFVVLPAIASGALAQEREQRTLEPLLLTPLTPLQIVWGKAAGVLSLGGLLLLGTLPLTSLCFLLGGVSPGELVAAYVALLGLALFTASIGIYCSAKWTNTIHATLWCYFLLPFFIMFLALFSGIGVIVAALALLGFVIHRVARSCSAWGARRKGQESTPQPARLASLWSWLGWLVAIAVAVFLLYVIAADNNIGSMAFGVFSIIYLIFISQVALQQAAREIVRPQEPTGSSRQKMQDFRAEWQQAMAVPAPYLPDPALLDAEREAKRREYERNVKELAADFKIDPTLSPPDKPTYKEAAFLSDKINPICAKDLRSGLLGKFVYLLRFSYLAVIGSEVLLILFAAALPAQPLSQEWTWFSDWAVSHLVALLVAGAWLGARSIAPEHEQQTLSQLIMTPLTPMQIVSGKIQAVLLYTLYVLMLGLPLSILLAVVKVVSWRAALALIAIELVFGPVAAAWGMFCSMHGKSTRRALTLSLGGVFIIAIGGYLFDNGVQQGLKLIYGRALISEKFGDILSALLSPLKLLSEILNPSAFIAAVPISGNSTPAPAFPVTAVLFLSLGLWAAVAALLFWLTARAFARYADTV